MFDSVGAKHRGYGFASRLRHGDTWDALNDARFFHQGRI